MKKILAVLLVLAVMLPLCAAASPIIGQGGTMYVVTADGKSLNLRSEPSTGNNIIGHLAYGEKVEVVRFLDNGWARLAWTGGEAYVQSRFLQWSKPAARPTPKPTEDPKKREEAALRAELASEIPVAPFGIVARATRSTGWVNLRRQPSTSTARVEQCPDGLPLTVIAVTTNWYRVIDPENGKTGYIHQDYVTVVPVPEPTPEPAAQIGTLNVNGAFILQCRIPDGYQLQVLSSVGSRIIASLTSGDAIRPQMLLNVSFDEMYADVQRMNDLSEEEMETLKATFTSMNAVVFEERETAHGSKLLIAREVGSDTDFVSIVSIYQGYSIEFVLSPNPEAAVQTLTDEQVQLCIDFLSDLDFIPMA